MNSLYICIFIFFVGLLIAFFTSLSNIYSRNYKNSTVHASSVFCNSYKNNSKRCVFRNLYFNCENQFLFLLTNDSIISGITSKNDFKNIFATSVINHSALPLKISITYDKKFNNLYLYEKNVFLLHRFKPDNIMHVIHDDIMPLFATYRDLCYGNISECIAKYDIVFSDENVPGNFMEWYMAFSWNKPFQLSKLNNSITYCFSTISVGLSIDTILFQYGFEQNRGSVNLSLQHLQILKHFQKFILNHFQIKADFQTFNVNVILMGRKLNRKILNEDYTEKMIIETMKKDFGLSPKLLNMDLSTNSSKDILKAISEANYFIGIHGSGMFLSIFLPENSVIIEMFPYGIEAENVSPIYAMSFVPGIWFHYFCWTNEDPFNSFSHPEYSSILGGLTFVGRKEQIVIFNSSSIPSKKCCNDPLFLSRMYQDTIVDDTFLETIKFALKTTPEQNKFNLNKMYLQMWFFPGVVNDIKCSRNERDLFLSWNPPCNVNSFRNVTYDIVIQTSYQYISVFTSAIFLYLKLDSEVRIWIKCNVFGNEGLDTYIEC